MSRKTDTIARFFRRFVSFSSDWKDFEMVLAPEFTQKEFPSPSNPKGHTINAAELLKRIGEMRSQLTAQHFEISNYVENDNLVAVEVVWTGLLSASTRGFKKGQNIKSYLCMIFEFQGDKIYAQRIYDSHESVQN